MHGKIDKDSRANLYQQLYQGVEQDIINGILQPGDKLPSYRWTAQKYGISLATVIRAYTKLAEEGVVEIIQGSGCYVKNISGRNYFADQIVIENFDMGQSLSQEIINFSSASPFVPAYPSKVFEGILSEMLEAGIDPLLYAYGSTQGNLFLRETLCAYLSGRGIPTRPEQIQIINGGQQGLDLVSKTFQGEELQVVAENPGYPVAVNSFLNAGAQVHSMPLEPDGGDLEALGRILEKRPIDLVYLMTNYQCPTNICWSPEKKRALLELAERHDFWILEDDCWSDLSFDGVRRESIKAMDRADRVILIKSFSKILMPGLRLAFMVLPERLTRRYITAKFFTDLATPELLQVCLAHFIRRGDLDRHIRWLRDYYRQKQAHMRDLIHASDLMRIENDTYGGLCFWVKMRPKVNSYALYRRMRGEGIRFLPGNLFSRDGSHGEYLRLSFAVATEQEMQTGLGQIQRALKEGKES